MKSPPAEKVKTKVARPAGVAKSKQAPAGTPLAAAAGEGKKKKSAMSDELDDIFAMTKGGGAKADIGGSGEAGASGKGGATSSGNDGLSPELKEIAERIKKAREAKAAAEGAKVRPTRHAWHTLTWHMGICAALLYSVWDSLLMEGI